MIDIKLFVVGLGRHGKDFTCEMISQIYGLKHISSSLFACEKVVFDVLSKKYNYSSLEECYNDRHNHRSEWYDLICEYNKDDKCRLSREMFSEFDIYCGLRSIEELNEARHLADLVIWVDATERLGITESSSSITITKEDADVTIYNNGTKEDLVLSIIRLFQDLKIGFCKEKY